MTADPRPIIDALLDERRGHALYGRADRVAQVDAELARYGVTIDGDHVEIPEPAPAETPEDDQVDDVETPEGDDDVETPEHKPTRRGRRPAAK